MTKPDHHLSADTQGADMKKLCQLCEGTGFVVCENDEEGWRAPKSDTEPADECPECAGYGFVTEDDAYPLSRPQSGSGQ